MKKAYTLIALLFCSVFVFGQGTGEVIITEIHNRPLKPSQEQLDAALPNNPAGADTTPNEGHTEWFEIYNTTSSPVVMDGWTLTDASSSSNVSTIGSFTIAPLSYAVFAGFNIPEAQGGVAFDYFYDYKKPSFNNESSYADVGDTSCPDGVIIEKADGTLVDEVRYDYGYGNYIGNESAGSSCNMNTTTAGFPGQNSSSKTSFMLNGDLAAMNAAGNDLAINWSYSTEVYDVDGNQKGTPGMPNGGGTFVDNDGDGFFSDVDCNDNNPDINPGATEIPNNGQDDDCDPSTPDSAAGSGGTGEVIVTEYHNRPLKPSQEQLDAALPNNPAGADATPNEGHTEWFEIYNTTSSPVVMDGWTLTDASSSSNFSVIGSFTIAPLSYAVFAGFNIPEAQGGVAFDYFYDYKKPSFNNESSYADVGDTSCPDGVIIEKADGTLVDEVRYDYGYGNYIGNESSGSCNENETTYGLPPQNGSSKTSFMLIVDPNVMNAEANDLGSNWIYSTIVYDVDGNQKGTPGLSNDGVSVVDNDGDGFFSDADCDDANADVNPGQSEIPYNGLDDDCDAMTLDDDLDQDGFGIVDDCDDNNDAVNSGQMEVAYNGLDDDCDPTTLDDDLDEDGFGIADDCDDNNPDVNDGQMEIAYNGLDDDCDPTTLDDDLDQDGFGIADDCDDDNGAVNPGQTEIINNGIDDDCDPTTSDEAPLVDNDGDGFFNDVDCDDNNAGVNPGQTEIPYNGINDDCDPTTIDDDLDNDGFGIAVDCNDDNAGVFPGQVEAIYNGVDDDCDPATLDDDLDQDGFAMVNDCEDNNAAINPGQTEVPYNGLDDDCDASTLDDDLDNDGFLMAVDCQDDNAAVFPGQTEAPYNGVDDDCDASTLDDDLDQDGFPMLNDCDDDNANINPSAIEIPDNQIDEDCDGADMMTSIQDVRSAGMKIYPNPANDVLIIESTVEEKFSTSIFNVYGKEMMVDNLGMNKLDVSKLPAGIYLLMINFEDRSLMKKITIQ